jgi:hypothetical protein
MTDFADQLDAIVVRARRVRKSIRAICLKATWSRWQAQAVAPNQSTIDRLNSALDDFERDAA